MQKNYTQDQAWDRFEKLPKELKSAILSEKTAETIYNTCNKFGKEKISIAAKTVRDVFLGFLSIDDFKICLKERLGINDQELERVYAELDNVIFLPIKSLISSFSKEMEYMENKKMPSSKETKGQASDNDDYREPIK